MISIGGVDIDIQRRASDSSHKNGVNSSVDCLFLSRAVVMVSAEGFTAILTLSSKSVNQA